MDRHCRQAYGALVPFSFIRITPSGIILKVKGIAARLQVSASLGIWLGKKRVGRVAPGRRGGSVHYQRQQIAAALMFRVEHFQGR